MKIKIKINELVLEGFNYHDYRKLSTAIESEFSILIRKNGLTHLTSKDLGRIGSSINLSNNDITVIGTEIARSIFQSES